MKKEGPITIFLPTSDMLQRALFEDEHQLIEPRGKREYMLRILDHVVFGDEALVQGRDTTLKAPFGGERKISWRGEQALIDGVPVLGKPRLFADDLVYEVANLLPPLPRKRR